MGDISIIARRLGDGQVQYGWSGNGGYCKVVGNKLLAWYDTPELVDYLFGLGQLMFIGKPNSEKENMGFLYTHALTGRPHNIGTSERQIFSKIAFVDYGYMYDLDNRWYYIVPGPFRIKLPLELVYNNMNDDGYEFDFLSKIVNPSLIQYILNDYVKKDAKFQELLVYTMDDDVREALSNSENPIIELFRHHNRIFSYFDDWVVTIADESNEHIVDFKMQPKMEERKETIEW